jgi:hypothetical protein
MASAIWCPVSGTMEVSGTDLETRRVVVTYRPPEDIRITHPNGDLMFLANEDGRWTFEQPGQPPVFEVNRHGRPVTWRQDDVNSFFDLSARVILDDLWWKAVPEPITPGEKLGRPTWEYTLKQRNRTEHVVVDAATGIRLTKRVAGRSWQRTIEFVAFTPKPRLSAKQFSWTGPVVPIPVDERLRSLQDQHLAYAELKKHKRDLRVPSYWPGGVGVENAGGNWVSGNFVAVLALPCRRKAPTLVQQPVDEQPYVPDPGPEHVYSWVSDDLRFTLMVESPIAEDDLRRVQESMVER